MKFVFFLLYWDMETWEYWEQKSMSITQISSIIILGDLPFFRRWTHEIPDIGIHASSFWIVKGTIQMH